MPWWRQGVFETAKENYQNLFWIHNWKWVITHGWMPKWLVLTIKYFLTKTDFLKQEFKIVCVYFVRKFQVLLNLTSQSRKSSLLFEAIKYKK